MKINLDKKEKFENRHIGPDDKEIEEMLKTVGASSLDELIEETIPKDIHLESPLDLPEAKSEHQFIEEFKSLVSKNKLYKSYIGLGYYNCIVPSVIQRNILENPGWYTAYTPYQAEIAQGRLEALVNFQTMVIDLTGMEIANASLLDEGTAAAEAMAMLSALKKGKKKKAAKFFVDQNIFPQTLEVLKTRAFPVGIEIEIGDIHQKDLSDENLFGILVQYPNGDGAIYNYQELFSKAHDNDVLIAAAADLLALTLLTPPGEMDADVVVGSSQRLGVPLGYGGPHAAYFATRDKFKRQVPGRIIGASLDTQGNYGYRMALQTREQHIRREKATSNICTAQVLLAVMAGMYGVYHGPDGLRNIAERVHGLTQLLNKGLMKLGYDQKNEYFFDTLKINTGSKDTRDYIKQLALEEEINFRYFNDDTSIGISFDETCNEKDVDKILSIFSNAANAYHVDISKYAGNIEYNWEESLIRKSDFLTHPVFNTHHSEHEMLRYMKSLENKDLSLVHSMIPLGSCTMKLNATTEMMPVTWPELGNLHPFVPINQTAGYQEMFKELEKWLNEITGFAATSLQPNSGAQGEFTGLMTIRAYHKDKGEDFRNVTLIPTSAHGTNFASAIMAGTKVVLVQSNENGNIDINDLRKKAEENKDKLAAFMVTYPTTYGVFNEEIKEFCAIIHDNGGLVYMDGANMNAQVGLTTPAKIGADVCHLNLHKTFCIPHGGGGPGMGPICVDEKLVPYLPTNPLIKMGGEKPVPAISAAPWGSASILSISYAYIALMGEPGLKKATQVAILSTNYLKERLKGHYEVLYAGVKGRNAHEMIIDCRNFKNAEIEVTDIAKRLMDYGFHAPTVSFPVPGALMVEPTESETLGELDRFCEALIQIRKEIAEIEEGKADKNSNVLKNAPHTAQVALSDNWEYDYSREKAVYPLQFVKDNKFWPAVSRIDSAYGDRNLKCSCIPVEEYMESEEDESKKTADIA